MSQQSPWGSPSHQQSGRRVLTPISTAFASTSGRAAPSASSPSRNVFFPATSSQPSFPPLSTRHVTSPNSSISSTSSPFSPSQSGGQQHQPNQLLSSLRSRSTVPSTNQQLASSAAASSAGSQGGGGGAPSSGGGGGATKLARGSPSLSQSSGVGSPTTSSNPTSAPSSQSLSKITVAQVFLLLSSLKEDRDQTKWETQVEQIRKLVDSHGMDVFTKYFRRLLQSNAAQIFPGSGRSSEIAGSYQLLVSEMQKITKDPDQAHKIAASIDTTEGDLFRDFDLSTFMDHFKSNPLAKTTLALAFKSVSRQDLRTKADAILSNNFQNFLMSLFGPNALTNADLVPEVLATIVDRLAQDPPRNWTDESRAQLSYAIHARYEKMGTPVPEEVSVALQVMELLAGGHPLLRLIQRTGPKGTSNLQACKDMLSSAETRDINYTQVAIVLLYMAITQNDQAYDPSIFVAALREHRAGKLLDWQDVVHEFDRERLWITKPQFLALYNALLPVAKDNENFDIQLLWGGTWNHGKTQLSFLVAFLSCTPDELDVSQIPRLRRTFSSQDFEDASDDVKSYAMQAMQHPFSSLEATAALFGNIFRSQESYNNAQILGIPEKVINANTDIFVVAASAVPKPWGGLQDQAMQQLFFPFLEKNLPNYKFVMHGVWKQDNHWLAARLIDVYTQKPIRASLILEHAQEHGWLDALVGMNNELSLDLAAIAHGRGLLDIQVWAQQTLQSIPSVFPRALASFLVTKAELDLQSQGEGPPPTTVGLAVKTVHPLLEFLQGHLSDEELVNLQRRCIHAYPRLINYGEGFDEIIDENGKNGNGLPQEADVKMQEHFKRMYSLESDVRDIIEALQRYKTSEDPGDQDLFACMIHGLFDEYSCFKEYPLEALATTSVLFGGIINYNLLSKIALQAALAMVLHAVHEYSPDNAMYKFGLQALLHFADRLQEWPSFCDRLLRIPGLQGTEIWTKAEEVVRRRRLADVNGETQNGHVNGDGDDYIFVEPSVPNFTCLHVDPPLHRGLYEEPDERVQDKVLFVLNNVSERNLNDKLQDLKEVLEQKHHQWFASYLVEERAKSQANFQQLFLDLLQLFNDRDLWEEVLRETYVAVIRMLNAESTMTSSSERTHMKNLGAWLGSITLARDKPIKYKNISFKDLLIEGHDTQRLVVVIPFTCKVLSQASKSTAFKPPNPWTMEIIRLLLELYHFAELKLNLKFEIEVLCKGLSLDHKSIEPSDSIRSSSRPLPEDEFLEPNIPDGPEAFNELSLMALNRPRGVAERLSPEVIINALPNFRDQLMYPPSSSRLIGEVRLKQIFFSAAQQAIVEIVGPVVERSVAIGMTTTEALVTKDFATEVDEGKFREASYHVAKILSGSLALVTCKEPLRMSITNNIRIFARDLPDQALPEGLILMFVNDNLDTVCSIVEHAAAHFSTEMIELKIQDGIRIRRLHQNTQPEEPFMHPQVSRWASFIPDPFKPSPGGLNERQLAIYEDFGRQSRGPSNHMNNGSMDGGQVLDALQDTYASVPNLPTPAEAPMASRQALQQQRLPPASNVRNPQLQPQVNGYVEAQSLADRAQELLAELQRAAREAPEAHITDLARNSPTRDIFELLLHLIDNPVSQKEALSLNVAIKLTTLIYTEPMKRLEMEVMIHLLGQLCQLSVQTARHVLLWLASIEDDRILNPTVTICLLSVGLLNVRRVDAAVARALNQRKTAALDFLNSLADDVLLQDRQSTLRTDLTRSFKALTQWAVQEPESDEVRRAMNKLQLLQAGDILPLPTTTKQEQMEYVFDEWIHLDRSGPNDLVVGAFLGQLQQSQVLKHHEDFATFLRICIDISVAAYEQQELVVMGNLDDAYRPVDALAALIVAFVVYRGEADGAVKSNKAEYLDAILCLVILVMCNHHHEKPERFNQKVFFRLFSNILCEMQLANEALAGFEQDGALVMGKAFLALQPKYFPGFAFAWLTLISHRMFMPALLKNGDSAGWDMYLRLLEVALTYTGELAKPPGLSLVGREYYRATLRLLLLLHHDFPEFLVENNVRLCCSIPVHCGQLRNVVNSAYPSSYSEMPDPFAQGLKVDRVDDIKQSPNLRIDFQGLLRAARIKDAVDNLLQNANQSAEDVERICRAVDRSQPKETKSQFSTEVDALLLNAVALYIGINAIDSADPEGPIFSPNSPQYKLLETLARKFHPELRYHFLNAMANQLRWPNSHTLYFSYVLVHMFWPPSLEQYHPEIQEEITRIFTERLLLHRPHPWGVIVLTLEILKHEPQSFWDLPFVQAHPEVENLFQALFRHIGQSPLTLH